MAPEILEEFFRTPEDPVLATGFPDDGRIVDAKFERGAVVFTVQSREFTEDSELVVLF